MTHYIIPIFISHLGCPHTCVFCNQSTITAISRDDIGLIRGKDVIKTATDYLATIPQGDRQVELSFFGGTFTGIPVALQVELLEAAQSLLQAGKIQHIRCSTRPDFITPEILERCRTFSMDIIELGVQSLDDEVLERSGRGHDARSVQQASKLIKAYGFTLGHQIMPGLPGATFASDLKTADLSIAMAPDQVRIYPTLVVRDTPLADLYAKGDYQPYDLETAVQLTGQLMERYESAGIKIIRVGLQATEEISERGSLIAGPNHPAFRELVLSKLLNDRLGQWMAKDSVTAGAQGGDQITQQPADFELKLNPKDISVLYADKKRYFHPNRPMIRRVVQDPAVPRGQVLVRRQEGNLFNIICI